MIDTKIVPKHILLKLLKSKGKEKVVEAARKGQTTWKGTTEWKAGELSREVTEVGGYCENSIKALTGKKAVNLEFCI